MPEPLTLAQVTKGCPLRVWRLAYQPFALPKAKWLRCCEILSAYSNPRRSGQTSLGEREPGRRKKTGKKLG